MHHKEGPWVSGDVPREGVAGLRTQPAWGRADRFPPRSSPHAFEGGPVILGSRLALPGFLGLLDCKADMGPEEQGWGMGFVVELARPKATILLHQGGPRGHAGVQRMPMGKCSQWGRCPGVWLGSSAHLLGPC